MAKTKNRRRYSLFEQRDGKWVRLSDYSYFKSSAVSIYQGSLLSSYFEGKRQELRPVPTCPHCERELVKDHLNSPLYERLEVHLNSGLLCRGDCQL